MKGKIISVALMALLAACDGATGPGNNGGSVAIRFETGASSGVSANILTSDNARTAFDQLTLTGTNGTLVIQDIRFIVEELELRSSTNLACSDNDDDRMGGDGNSGRGRSGGSDDDDCEFEGGPFIVDLPLEGNAGISTQNFPAGRYDSFKFEIDNLDMDDDRDDGDDDATERQRVTELLAEMRSVYPNFPSRASMVVKGTQNGQPFVVYFRSDIDIESALNPPLQVPGDNLLTVNLDPSKWFKSGNQVVNLLALNGQLVEFRTEFRSGVNGSRRGRG